MRITRLLRACERKRDTFYVTTPIYYVNATPHIGHLYSSLIADAACRWRKLSDPGVKCKFATGTDEHGAKIQRAAKKYEGGGDLPGYCDEISAAYRRMSQEFGIDYSDFVRTTEERHALAVQAFWRKIRDRGHIRQSKYSGWYCVSDESFLVESQLAKAADGSFVSSESGHPVEWTEEQNYVFQLSSFHDELRRWLQKDKLVRPKKFQKILLEMLEECPDDVSVSRPSSRVSWGIPVPEDDSQTVYVWLDALVNYLTAAGYPEESSYTKWWPCDVHVVGKDILKFHGLYWPAFLMSADMEPPKSILCHSHWTVDGEKMSKSKGNVVSPSVQSQICTAEGLRYFLLREGVPHSDGNYSDVKLLRIVNSELADTLGNLLSRCTGKALNPRQVFPAIQDGALREISKNDAALKLFDAVSALPDTCHAHYDAFDFYKAVDATIATLHAANSFFESSKPWQLKTNPEVLDAVLHVALETLRIASVVLTPIIPKLTKQLMDKIGTPDSRRTWRSIERASWSNLHLFEECLLSEDSAVLFKRIVAQGDKKVRSAK